MWVFVCMRVCVCVCVCVCVGGVVGLGRLFGGFWWGLFFGNRCRCVGQLGRVS